MTTEPKAEGVEAVGYVDGSRLHELREGRLNIALWNEPCIYAGTPLYTHPAPSAVEALARAAEAVYVDSNNEDLWNALEAALAHPEIAALLKETK